jgi:type VI secretion system protein ImpE
MTAYELFQQARLTEAIDAALGAVKSAPTDVNARLLLCDLLCFANQLDRADGQLEVVVQQASDLALGVSLYRQLIRAEVERQDALEKGRAPEFMEQVPDVLRLHLRALIAMREDAAGEAAELLRQADELRPRMRGDCDAASFEDFRDLDDITAPFLEVLTSTGKYFWVDWARIESLEFQPPKQLRDLLWRPTEMVIRAGPSAVVYAPVLYVGSHRSGDEVLRIGRTTEWVEMPSEPTRGCGQRMFLVGEESRSLLSIQKIAFSYDRAASTLD